MTNKNPNLKYYPKSLFRDTSDILGNEFTRLPKRLKTGYVNTFWTHNGIIKHNQHNRDPESFAMGADEVIKNFVEPRDFNAVNHKGYYIRPSRGNRDGNQYVVRRKEEEGNAKCEPTNWLIKTKEGFQGWREGGVKGCKNGFRLSPKITNLLNSWYIKSEEELGDEVGFTNHDGGTLEDLEETLGGAIYRDKSNTKNTINVNLQVIINKESLKTHKVHLEVLVEELNTRRIKTLDNKHPKWKETVGAVGEDQGKQEEVSQGNKGTIGGVNRELPLQTLFSKSLTIDGVNQRILEINRLLVSARECGNSSIPVIYTEANTGRYTAKGAVLQGYHKSVRCAALGGYYEYDIEAAHQNILIQLLDKQGNNFPELDVLREYVANKKVVRVRLSEELDTSVAVVKEIINALTYGAQLSKSPKQSLYDSCEGNKELLDRVVSHQWLKDSREVFKLAYKYLVSNKDNIVNVLGIPYTKEDRGDSSELAHILQGYERLALDAIIKHSNRNEIALLVHDCVVFYNKQSTDKLSEIVQSETGLCLEFSEVKY